MFTHNKNGNNQYFSYLSTQFFNVGAKKIGSYTG